MLRFGIVLFFREIYLVHIVLTGFIQKEVVMSGKDSPSGGSLGNFGGRATACDTLGFETLLSSPKQGVIATIAVGDILEITTHIQHGIETVVALANGNIAGGIVENSEKIKSCIEQGFSYQADVREINGARVKVFVRNF